MSTGPVLSTCLPCPCDLPIVDPYQNFCTGYLTTQLKLDQYITLGQIYALGYEAYNIIQALTYGNNLSQDFAEFRSGLGNVLSTDLYFWLIRLSLAWVAPWLIVISVLLCFLLIYKVINISTFAQLFGLNLVAGIFAYLWINEDTRNQVNKLGTDVGNYLRLSLEQYRTQLTHQALKNVKELGKGNLGLGVLNIAENIALIVTGKNVAETNDCKFCQDGVCSDISYCVLPAVKTDMEVLDDFLRENGKEFFSQ